MSNIRKNIILLVVPMMAVLVLALSAPAMAVNPLDASCNAGNNASEVCNSSGSLFGGGGIFSSIINALFFLIGAVAVIVIVVGGIRYITAGGDQSRIESAKNTILYAVVGLILAVAAGGIVNFVLDRL